MINRRSMHSDNGFCTSSQRNCTRRKLEGYQFCWRHILEDRSSPYRQCSRASAQTGRRCTNAAPKSDRKEGLCVEHQAQAAQSCQKDAARRRCQTAASLLERLEHYRPAAPGRPSVAATIGGGGGDAATSALTAAAATTKLLSKHGGVQPIRAVATQHGSDTTAAGWTSAEDSCSEEPLPCDSAWRGEPNSDNDSGDSEADDPFKYVDVFTEEEAVKITREKLIRLQSLYVDQFKHLQQKLVDSHLRYLAATAKVDSASAQGASAPPHYLPPSMDSSGSTAAATASNILARERNRAAVRYRKRTGIEALMHQRSKECLTAVRSGAALHEHTLLPAMQRCNAGAGRAGRCSSRVVPLSKYCLRHILSDPHQVLFKQCSFLGGRCERLVPAVFSRAPRCDLHEGFSSSRAAAIIQRAQHPVAAPLPLLLPAQQQQHRVSPTTGEVENGAADTADAADSVAAALGRILAELSPSTIGVGIKEQNASVTDIYDAVLDQTPVSVGDLHLQSITVSSTIGSQADPPNDNDNEH